MGQPVHVRFGSSLCENSDVELARGKFVSITLNNKRTALAATVEGRKERKQFCAFSARARFHTAWVKRRHRPTIGLSLLDPQERTSAIAHAVSASCRYCCKSRKSNNQKISRKLNFGLLCGCIVL